MGHSILKFAPLLSKRMAFLPVTDDDDELIRAINDESNNDQWELHEKIDSKALEKFWENARLELQEEIRHTAFETD